MKLSKELVKNFQVLHLLKTGAIISPMAAELELKELANLVRLTANHEVTT